MRQILSEPELDQFKRDGYLVVKDAISKNQLSKLSGELQAWVEESRNHAVPFGPSTIDGRPRFDMGEEHSYKNPALRRVNNPSDISKSYFEIMSNARTLDMVVDLIGPDIKFHHCKINLKCPGANTIVHYHQDFAFTPHSNDDVITALLMLDDVTRDNGCLMVVPGSHKGPMYSLFQGNHFVGRVTEKIEMNFKRSQIPVTGPAGAVCLMHTRLAHGSAANQSHHPRSLYICVYTAADAIPLSANPMPSMNEGMIVRGRPSLSARMIDFEVELPKQPKSPSFFTVQGQHSAEGTS